MNWKVVGLLTVLNIIYLLVGGFIFKELESSEEVNIRTDLLNKSVEFLEAYPCVSKEVLMTLIQDVIEAYDAGVIGGDLNASLESTNWDIASSIFFSTTVVTTIGYGNLSPTTSAGKAFCVIYALIGIPLMLILLVGLGQKLHIIARRIENNNMCNGGSKKAKYLKIAILLSAGCAFFILIPSIVFSCFEDWTYSEALYFCIITLTTIGFGDFVAGAKEHYEHRTLYRICLVLWTIIGLAWLSLLLDTFQDFVQSKVDHADSVVSVVSSKGKEEGRDKISLTGIDGNKNAMSNSTSEICDGM